LVVALGLHAGDFLSKMIIQSMNIEDLARQEIRGQPVYEAGKPISHVARAYGLDPKAVIKLASNENALGPSPKALAAVRAVLDELNLYPDAGCYDLSEKVALYWGIGQSQLIFGNGSNDIIDLLACTFLERGDEVVMGKYAFIVYKLVAHLAGAKAVGVEMTKDFSHDLDAMKDAITPRTKIVFFTHPNNPTGGVNKTEDILAFARALPEHVILCFDEAYAEYMDNPPDLRPLIAEGRPILCCRTFSKIYGLAGLRVGYGYGPQTLVQLVQRARQPFNVNALAQAAACAALDDVAFVEKARAMNAQGLVQLGRELESLGLQTVPSDANFLLFKVGDNAFDLAQYLLKNGVIVRTMKPYGLDPYLRVTVGTPEQNTRFLELLKSGLNAGGAR